MFNKSVALTLCEIEFLPYEPQPNVKDGINSLYISPIPPTADGVFTSTRQAFILSPKSFCNVSSSVWITAVCPNPPKCSVSSQI
ncbi:Uncharacterised protein [Staphylococcus aureus]|nr:Uncharacterised protein [Staphylococcus aureus]CAC5594720.1 Uncharacterised protein [Staphylococcus aureus]CAC7000691.1 Uncharacterised protein [Staphylococcus aureus]CAC7013576.1 Uncharacterised protein [Staphylococcus aureus]CPM11171.1 Uncharacterised protein [Staphylococcus aureus]